MVLQTKLIALALVIQLGQTPGPQHSAPGTLTPPPVTQLTRESVRRLIKVLPAIAKESAQYQSRFMGSFGPAGTVPNMSNDELERLNKVFQKHGFEFEEFVMQVSALMATYIVVDPVAFDNLLPREDSPEIKRILEDPAVPQEQKLALRQQIASMRKNKESLKAQFALTTNEHNQKIIKSMLKDVRRAIEAARAASQPVRPTKPQRGK